MVSDNRQNAKTFPFQALSAVFQRHFEGSTVPKSLKFYINSFKIVSSCSFLRFWNHECLDKVELFAYMVLFDGIGPV
jgi:hypothetical protein